MSEIKISEASTNLRGKVVVLTGGAQGIGAAAVELLYDIGAHVFFGDWDEKKGRQLEQDLKSRTSKNGGSVAFRQVDVRNHDMQLALFDDAHNAHNRVDVAIQCAGLIEPKGWFEPEDLNLETVRKEPIPIKDNIEINLTSVLLFSRMALAYMKRDRSTNGTNGSTDDFSKSIVLTSSIAGITEAPGLFAYSAAKHGVIGIMRALRRFAPAKYGVRANAICPWATDTQLLAGVAPKWKKEKMPMNTPKDVALLILQCAADQSLNGKAVFVAGGRGFDTEEGIDRTLPQWMGEENAKVFLRGQEILGLGDNWVDGQ
ncbi:putative oxidoreductase,short chain dehydrogenase [Coniochaeta sp. PMI_546]|nr:putative oxidoreductase,short chain dehydrogenase [Coniochaeta sp. PMI_546]